MYGLNTFKQAFTGMLNKIADLFTVKSIVTFAVTAVFVIQSLRGNLTNEIVTIATMVLSFYFGVQHEQNRNGSYDGNGE